MTVEKTTLGELVCTVITPTGCELPPRRVVILCHGFGAPGTDLVPLAGELLRLNRVLEQTTCFVFPRGPLSLDEFGLPTGRAWWPVDIERFAAAVETGNYDLLRHETPVGLVEAREKLIALINDVRQTFDVSTGQIILGGFSQGAMLTTDTALSLPQRPGGLCIFSGTLLCEEQWRELAAVRGPLPVLQSHGRQDPLLPFPAAEWLRDMLTAAGLPVEFLPFDGMHTIPAAAVERCAALLGVDPQNPI